MTESMLTPCGTAPWHREISARQSYAQFAGELVRPGLRQRVRCVHRRAVPSTARGAAVGFRDRTGRMRSAFATSESWPEIVVAA